MSPWNWRHEFDDEDMSSDDDDAPLSSFLLPQNLRVEWLWLTADWFGHRPANLRLLPTGQVQWNHGTPHGWWKYRPAHDVIAVQIRLKAYYFRRVPGTEAWVHSTSNHPRAVVLIPPTQSKPAAVTSCESTDAVMLL